MQKWQKLQKENQCKGSGNKFNMRLKIYNDNYIIKSDPRQFLLYEVRKKQKEEEEEKETVIETEEIEEDIYLSFLASCATISQVLKHIVQREKRMNESTTWRGYFKHLKEIEERMNQTYANIIEALGEDIIDKKLEKLPDNTLKYGEPVNEEPKKRGRKKKE